jgi:D-sedoheptulose 7-phosphate isomerase
MEKTGELIKQVLTEHKRLSDELAGQWQIIDSIAEMITKSVESGGTVYLCGNGGSAADAQHIAGELVGRFKKERKGIAAVALTTDSSVMTSVANDYGYDYVMKRQAEALVKGNDLLWAISTSGASKSIIEAAVQAKEKGAGVISFTGKKNSELEKLSDLCFCAESKETARTQEIHQIAYHIICELVENEIIDNGEAN